MFPAELFVLQENLATAFEQHTIETAEIRPIRASEAGQPLALAPIHRVVVPGVLNRGLPPETFHDAGEPICHFSDRPLRQTPEMPAARPNAIVGRGNSQAGTHDLLRHFQENAVTELEFHGTGEGKIQQPPIRSRQTDGQTSSLRRPSGHLQPLPERIDLQKFRHAAPAWVRVSVTEIFTALRHALQHVLRHALVPEIAWYVEAIERNPFIAVREKSPQPAPADEVLCRVRPQKRVQEIARQQDVHFVRDGVRKAEQMRVHELALASNEPDRPHEMICKILLVTNQWKPGSPICGRSAPRRPGFTIDPVAQGEHDTGLVPGNGGRHQPRIQAPAQGYAGPVGRASLRHGGKKHLAQPIGKIRLAVARPYLGRRLPVQPLPRLQLTILPAHGEDSAGMAFDKILIHRARKVAVPLPQELAERNGIYLLRNLAGNSNQVGVRARRDGPSIGSLAQKHLRRAQRIGYDMKPHLIRVQNGKGAVQLPEHRIIFQEIVVALGRTVQ